MEKDTFHHYFQSEKAVMRVFVLPPDSREFGFFQLFAGIATQIQRAGSPSLLFSMLYVDNCADVAYALFPTH